MDTAVIYTERADEQATGRFWKGIRRMAGPIFMFAFLLFTANSIAAGHLQSAGKNSPGAAKWTLAYRSLERALEKAVASRPV